MATVFFPKIPLFLELSFEGGKNGITSFIQPSVIIFGFEFGNHYPVDNPLCHKIRNPVFYSVASIYIHFSIVPGQCNNDSIVLAFLAYSPFLAPFSTQHGYVLPICGTDYYTDNLGRGGVRIADQLIFKSGFLGRGKQVYIIINGSFLCRFWWDLVLGHNISRDKANHEK